MGKTKTQAQKREEREMRQKQQAEVRLEEAEQRRQAILQQVNETKEPDDDSFPQALSKKEQRALKKKALKEGSPVSLEKDDALGKEPKPIFSMDFVEVSVSKLLKDLGEVLPQTDMLSQLALDEQNEVSAVHIPNNHSTHCPGLNAVCIKLTKLLPPKSTITRGKLYHAQSHAEEFELRYQRPEDNAYKFLARSGHTVQEVFIIVPEESLTIDEIVTHIKNILQEIEEKQGEEKPTSVDLLSPNQNRVIAEALADQWRGRAKLQSEKEKAADKEAKERQRIAEQAKKLEAHVGKAQAEEFAERDVAIITGKDRTKHSMK